MQYFLFLGMFFYVYSVLVIVLYTGYSANYILFEDNHNNTKIQKIDNILAKCSDNSLYYFYKILHISYSCFKWV